MNFLLICLGSCLISTAPVESGKPVVNDSSAGVSKTLLLQLVNDARKKGRYCGNEWCPPAPPLAWNDLLEKAALNHSNDMQQRAYFSHTSPEGAKAPARLEAVGYNWRTYGENIAQGYETEKDVIAGWLKSEGHCKNIMSKEFKEMGVAKASNYWTQEFGVRLK